jgi:hypothetical protein
MMHFTLTRGHRSPNTLLLLPERKHYLREAARFFPMCSQREQARRVRIALLRYQGGRWRRERIETTCPARCRDLDAVLWKLLKVRDHVPSEMTIRRLFVNHGA